MKVLVVNAGSSSLKYQLIDMDNESVLAKGNCDRIGTTGCISHKAKGESYKKDIDMPSHSVAFEVVVDALTKGELKVIDSMDEISAVGHRVVHGGQIFKNSTVITDEVIKQIEELSVLAPLHNPAAVLGIKACINIMGADVPQVAVFDTSFHSTLPDYAYMYSVPYEYYEKYGVRKYGFHGTSHKYVSNRCAEVMGKSIDELKIVTCHLGNGCSISAVENGKKKMPEGWIEKLKSIYSFTAEQAEELQAAVIDTNDAVELKVITCHIGNGSSIAAVENGKCVDTTMGFTPVDGMMMGTRTGSVDPSVITFIGEKENLSYEDINNICNKKSGLLGVSGLSNDSRDVCDAADRGEHRSLLARNMQHYQVLKYIGSYIAAMGGVDAIVFTGGLGENNPGLRSKICDKLSFLGITCDEEVNDSYGKEVRISTPDSKVAVYVIPTDEEMVIARDTVALTK